ncbi:MAG: GNAT family N-acetyltransferase [Rhizobacter sp.]|nr:GNAT family N-acetyltransferase [Burkholderiales bacterium]
MTATISPTVWPDDVTLERDGIRLEPILLVHEAGLLAAASDGELWNIRYTSVPEPQETLAYIQTALKQRSEGSRLAFAVIDLAANKVIGSTSYHDIVPAIKRVEIGWTWYAKSNQRSRVNTLCKLMLMQHAFDTLGCDVVGWRVSHMNFASQRAVERLGAKRDGVLRHHAPIRDGKVRDTVMYSMLAAEWPVAKQQLEAKLARKAAPRAPPSSKVTLQPITADTLRAILKLNPGAVGERMVATNAWSIAQAAYSANAVPRAIMADGVLVGFIMMYDTTIDPTLAVRDQVPLDSVEVWRLMIDFQHQGSGYGKAAISEAAQYAATRPGVVQLRLSYVPVEGNPASFYRKLGFLETGEKDGIEIVMAQSVADLL